MGLRTGFVIFYLHISLDTNLEHIGFLIDKYTKSFDTFINLSDNKGCKIEIIANKLLKKTNLLELNQEILIIEECGTCGCKTEILSLT